MANMPDIYLTFQQRAVTAISRSDKGVAVLIVRDDTAVQVLYEFQSISDVAAKASDFTSANKQAIDDVFAVASPYKVYVVRIATSGAMTDATNTIEHNIPTAWVAVASATASDHTALVSWIGTMDTARKTYRAIVYNVTAPDKRHIVNFAVTSVKFADTRSTQTGDKYIPTLLGMIAASGVDTSLTNMLCTNLSAVTEVADNSAAVAAGKLILVNTANGVSVAAGVNSLTTYSGGNTADMSYIDFSEIMDLIADDIIDTFKTRYSGQFKNTYSNQMLLVSAIDAYFSELESQDILSDTYENTVSIDTSAQRAALIASGHADAVGWTDTKVKETPVGRTVYLSADMMIVGAMESLHFAIQI